MIYSENLLLNGSGELFNMSYWSNKNAAIRRALYDRPHVFQINGDGYIQQTIKPRDFTYPPEEFLVRFDFIVNPKYMPQEQLDIRVDIELMYTDGIRDIISTFIDYNTFYIAEILGGNWYQQETHVIVNTKKVVESINIKIQNNTLNYVLYVDEITILQDTGAAGPEGPEGKPGPPGAQGKGYRIKGTWVSGTVYINDNQYVDVVTHKGSSFYCKYTHASSELNKPNEALEPLDTNEWGVLAIQGAQGPVGEAGIDGVSPYSVTIISTNGNIFKKGFVETTLVAIVYLGGIDVTSTLDESQFNWTRVSGDANTDIIWNALHKGMKEVYITSDDVINRATFDCSIIE